VKTLTIIQDRPVNLHGDGHLSFIADADIDCDGGANPQHDPCWQRDTTLHHHGHPVDAERVPFIVVPPSIVRAVAPVVMGCQAKITNTLNGQSCLAVVADTGPAKKLGELSPAAARRLGINPNPNTGGESRPVILYELWPGQPATVDGESYQLQPAG